MNTVVEASYPISFRSREASELGKHLKHHNSVVLVGMKRVGISNFLRFFLNHPQVPETYIQNGKQLFVVVDINDLIERSLSAFWMLTLKRVCDGVETLDVSEEIKQEAKHLFVKSIQLKDQFFTYESVHKVLSRLVAENIYPVLFLIRFDRLKKEVTSQFFANLQGLVAATDQKLSYVFTSFRPLYELAPKVFTRSALSVFAHDMFLQPASKEDIQKILVSFQQRYCLDLDDSKVSELIALSTGHVQYLQLALLNIRNRDKSTGDSDKTETVIKEDEEIRLQSEELYESLTKCEQQVLLKISNRKKISEDEKRESMYMWDTGIVTGEQKYQIFNPLLEVYLNHLRQKQAKSSGFTKKEGVLFNLLKTNLDKTCDREEIIEAVWPDQEELGVTDWAIDRLVSRVRMKLKFQQSSYKIVTVVARGYKMVGV